jgi:hypothetical protein
MNRKKLERKSFCQGTGEILRQALRQSPRVGMSRFFGAWNDDVVIERTQVFPLPAKEFPDATLDSVSIHRAAARFDRDSKPKMTKIVWNPENDALGNSKNLAISEKTPVLPRVVETQGRRKSLGA